MTLNDLIINMSMIGYNNFKGYYNNPGNIMMKFYAKQKFYYTKSILIMKTYMPEPLYTIITYDKNNQIVYEIVDISENEFNHIYKKIYKKLSNNERCEKNNG